ncbi:IS110 family transposase [Clostridium beijerinckii]
MSKRKSTICILKAYNEIISMPYELTHTETKLSELINSILNFKEETRVVMEATGAYHLPVLSYIKEHNIFVSLINPLVMKKYAAIALRKGKTDKIDAIKIANYRIDNWFRLIDYQASDELYSKLKILERQYSYYIRR